MGHRWAETEKKGKREKDKIQVRTKIAQMIVLVFSPVLLVF